MRNLYKTLCAVLAAALLALTLLPAGVLAAGADLEISAQNFPDANFRVWLTNPANLNGAGADGTLSAEELAAVTKLDLSGQNIADLTGIEHFTALESLNVSNNRLTKLDVRANTRLRYLYCATNFLTSLDVTRCAELIDLNCERNQLTTLDLSGNPKLQQLYCRHNFLSALDVSHNLELVFIETFDNQLTQFDASMLKKLRFLHIDYNRLTELDMSHNPVLEGNGFVAANNSLNRLTLPNIPDFSVEAEVFLEQNPRTGYDRTEWYYDQDYTRPIGEKDVIMATGQTVYARWVPNPYTVYYRANGGTGSMADQAVVYDQEFALTPNAFSRTGYTFDTWHTYADGIGGASYTNGQTVRNLAGGNGSRDAVYLYAQWKANAYTIQYNGNGGSGDTQATAAVYDTPANLAENGFSNSEGVFLGWARDPQAKQPEFFAGQPVKNLTADPNGTVTLYAVWMSNAEIQQGYLDQVAALQARYTEADYYTEDWAALTGAADTARSAIEGAGSVQETMQQALNTAALAMADVPTRTDRARQTADAWEKEHSAILARLDSFVPLAQRTEYAAQASAAAGGAAVSNLAEKTGLTNPQDKSAAAAAARALVADRLDRLTEMQQALAWMNGAADWCGKPMAEIKSANAAALNSLEQQLTGLDAGVRFYCDPDAAQALTTRAALAREKAEAVQQLNAVYDELTGWQYTPENAALLAQKKQSALDEIEAADSTGLPAALFTAGKAALEQVDPIPKTVTVTSWPAASLVRGQALSQASLNGGKADVPGRFVWKEPDTRPQAGGSYPVVFVPADSRRYTSVEGQAALTVNEPAPAPTAAPATPTPTPAPAATPSPTKAPAAVRPTATPSATASATPSPKPTATVTPAPTATATPAPTAEAPAQSGPESGSGMGPVWLLAGGAAALLVLAAVLVLRARRGE